MNKGLKITTHNKYNQVYGGAATYSKFTVPLQTSSQFLATVFMSEPKEQRQILQLRLKNKGFYSSKIDGIWGEGTRSAIELYIKDKGLEKLLRTKKGSKKIIQNIILGESKTE